MSDPYTIRIFVADGDPEGIRIIDRMNWTGIGIAFPRNKTKEVVRYHGAFAQSGVYILIGFEDDESNIPTIYIGQTDNLNKRIEEHSKHKDFWDRAIVFLSSNNNLNRGHIEWLEYGLISRANQIARSTLDNQTVPKEPSLTAAEKSDTQVFMNQILEALPLLGLSAFAMPKTIAEPKATTVQGSPITNTTTKDTIIVPAKEDGFERVFLNEDCWYAIRISGGMLDQIKYIAAYQSSPVSAITHCAPIARIESYGEHGKYKLIFSEKAKRIKPIPFGDAKAGTLQSSRYTTYEKLNKAEKVDDLWD